MLWLLLLVPFIVFGIRYTLARHPEDFMLAQVSMCGFVILTIGRLAASIIAGEVNNLQTAWSGGSLAIAIITAVIAVGMIVLVARNMADSIKTLKLLKAKKKDSDQEDNGSI